MLPFGVAFGLPLKPLVAGDFLPICCGIRVVWVCDLRDGAEAVLDVGVVVFDADLAAIAILFVGFDFERGGEGGRPSEGANCEDTGSLRFSRGFRNMRGQLHGRGQRRPRVVVVLP